MDCAFLSLLGWASREEPGGCPHVLWSSPCPLWPGPWMAVGRGRLCPLSSGGKLAGHAGSCGPQSLSWLCSPMFRGRPHSCSGKRLSSEPATRSLASLTCFLLGPLALTWKPLCDHWALPSKTGPLPGVAGGGAVLRVVPLSPLEWGSTTHAPRTTVLTTFPKPSEARLVRQAGASPSGGALLGCASFSHLGDPSSHRMQGTQGQSSPSACRACPWP